MASTEGLVPITRAYLSKFYDKFPLPPLSPDVVSIDVQLQEQSELLGQNHKELVAKLSFDSPHKIDENLWRNREQIEEIIFLMDRSSWPVALKEQDASTLQAVAETLGRLRMELNELLKAVEGYQSESSEKVFNMILTYMPQDFRGSLIKQQRDRSERRRQAEVDSLLNGGGSIHEKYGLLWKQQMDRRRQLAMLGSATGVYKTLVRFLVGVPQVLLDFVQQINDHNGPMEEQRQRYGPPLYHLTQLALHTRIFLELWWLSSEHPNSDYMGLVQKSIEVYTTELDRFLKFLRGVFESSPFLISAEEAGNVEGKNVRALADEFREIVIANGKSHEVLLNVESEGSYVAWDFKLTSGKDVGFSVNYIESNGMKTAMLPYHRCEAHQGNFYSPGVGRYKLVWDNSYSTFYRKTLRYKVDAIPPVADAQKSSEDEDG